MIGETFRKIREDAGIDLKDIADNLRIRCEYLRAIEDNDFKSLPADVYTKGYIREYARFLGIDPKPFIEGYNRGELQELQQEVASGLPESHPGPERMSPASRRVIFFGVVAAIILISIVLFVYLKTTGTAQKQQAIVSMPQPLAGGKDTATLPAAAVFPGQHVLKVTAVATAWLRVDMGEGKIEDVLMKPGDSREWTSKGGFNLWLGNAGGISLTLDNKELGAPGLSGQTMRLRLPAEESSAVR